MTMLKSHYGALTFENLYRFAVVGRGDVDEYQHVVGPIHLAKNSGNEAAYAANNFKHTYAHTHTLSHTHLGDAPAQRLLGQLRVVARQGDPPPLRRHSVRPEQGVAPVTPLRQSRTCSHVALVIREVDRGILLLLVPFSTSLFRVNLIQITHYYIIIPINFLFSKFSAVPG
jgi:hypothetical protein